MSKTGIIAFLTAFMLGLSCATSKVSNTACWVNREKVNNKYKNIYILGMLKTGDNNISVEHEMATQARQRGIVTTMNYDVQPASEISPDMRRDLALMKIKEYACDAICTIAVKDIHVESHYVPGPSIGVSGYVPYGSYGGYYNQFSSYYADYYGHGGMGGYYASGSAELKPGKVETDKTYFVECNLFDATTYDLLFSVQSQAFNPTDIEKVSKEYCQSVFRTLEKEGVIKKKSGK